MTRPSRVHTGRRSRKRTARSGRVVCTTALVVTGLVGVLLTAGCTGSSEAPAAPRPTPLERLDVAQVSITPSDFCGSIDDAALSAVLPGRSWELSSYGDGEEAEVTSGVRDVAHEYSCSWTADDGQSVRAWVFARPVTRHEAKQLVDDARSARGCTAVDAPVPGEVGAAVACHGEDPTGAAATTARLSGLLGTTWLSCETSAPAGDSAGAQEQVRRAETWCASVVDALAR